MDHDLGLCVETFMTTKPCRFGNDCYWRHDKLLPKEIVCMQNLCANCIAGMEACRMFSERPKVTPWDVVFDR